LVDPVAQLDADVVAGALVPLLEELGLGGVAVLVDLEVVAQSLHELFVAHVLPEHTHDCAALVVAYGIEDFVHVLGLVDGHANGVRGLETVELECAQTNVVHKRVHVLEFGLQPVSAESLDKGCKRLVQPQVIPPLHCYQVAEPLVGQLVADYLRHPDLLVHACILANEQVDFPLSHQTPILHGARFKLAYCNHI